ncbi:DDE superfamily endonuclease [Paraburkholderia tuberum]|uniref:DDE superfamily endonuclease n=1 Tax=Paraburkholderia tuberum TaxID=157910 RepID=A0A1H1KI43_9BURK|nr:DDE superfamily endonuclease [Paraburkholderia tuberum]
MKEDVDEFDAYLNHLAQALGHADRHAGLKGYCSGLVLPLSRKSVEPMAAHIDPLHASAKHQSLHHFVAKAEWSDRALLQRVREWVMPALGAHAAEEAGYYWIIDDTGFPKKGRHSVGVARQYCGQLGKSVRLRGSEAGRRGEVKRGVVVPFVQNLALRSEKQ